MIIHINEDRFERIRSQGYRLGTYPDPSPERLARIQKQSDNEYHLLDGEHGACAACGGEFDSVTANTPAELETVKYTLYRLQVFRELSATAVGFQL